MFSLNYSLPIHGVILHLLFLWREDRFCCIIRPTPFLQRGMERREVMSMRDQLTENDIKKIEEEIEYRKLVVRKEAIEAVKEARAQGDLSENFEYYAAKRDKNKN